VYAEGAGPSLKFLPQLRCIRCLLFCEMQSQSPLWKQGWDLKWGRLGNLPPISCQASFCTMTASWSLVLIHLTNPNLLVTLHVICMIYISTLIVATGQQRVSWLAEAQKTNHMGRLQILHHLQAPQMPKWWQGVGRGNAHSNEDWFPQGRNFNILF